MSPVKAFRFDISRLDAVKRDHSGYLEATAAVTRTGVFVYRRPDGTITRELRHPDEVFKKDSLATLKHRPVTMGHVGKLDTRNTKHIAVGSAIGEVTHGERLVSTGLQIHDEDAIAKVLDEENPSREISCGYEAEIERRDGVFNGEKYDHEQKGIVYNHIAVVRKGRAGHEVRMNLDEADAVMSEHVEINKDELERLDQGDPKRICGEMWFNGTEKERQAFGSTEGRGRDEHPPKAWWDKCIAKVGSRSDEATETETMITVRVSAHQNEHDSTSTMEITTEEGVTAVFTSEGESKSVKEFQFDKSVGWTIDKAKEWAQTHRHDSLDEDPGNQTRNDDMSKITIRRDAIATKTFKADAFKISLDGTADSAEKAVDQVQERLDAAVAHILELEGKNQALQGKLDAAGEGNQVTAKQLDALVRQRTDACGAAHYLGVKGYNNLETSDIKKAVVMAAYRKSIQDMNPEDITPEYIEGRYDAILDKIRGEHKNLESFANLKDVVANPELLGTGHGDTDTDPRTKFLNDTNEMWRTPQEKAVANA